MIFDSAARANAEDNIRKTAGQLLGGAAVLIGTALAYLQFSQQQQTSQRQFSQQQETSQKQFLQQQQASRDLLISNQVAKGFEQLGSEKIVVRLGGIYALEGVMNTSEQYHQPVLEGLSAFVRDGTRTEITDAGRAESRAIVVGSPVRPRTSRGEPAPKINLKFRGPPTTDIQAALTVIGRRKLIGTARPDLASAQIPNSDLSEAQLAEAILVAADLRAANLSHGDLRKADLAYANLSGANLGGANLEGASPYAADLRGADLSGANLTDAEMAFANLSVAELSDADLLSAGRGGLCRS
jgi:Pentapeptide repeats (8 copies)